jgi:hypothetical protein
MADDLEAKTLNGRLIKEGFAVEASIPNEELPEMLTALLIELARGRYTEMRVVPDDVALGNSEWKVEKPSHIVYVKDNPNHPGYNPSSVRLVMPGMVHRKTGEYNLVLPVASIK